MHYESSGPVKTKVRCKNVLSRLRLHNLIRSLVVSRAPPLVLASLISLRIIWQLKRILNANVTRNGRDYLRTRPRVILIRKQTVSNVMPASVSLQSDTLHGWLGRVSTSRDDVFPANGFKLLHKQSLRGSWWAVYCNEDEKSIH